MDKFVLYCKSYIKDLPRAKALAESINQHNTDNIPFYVSCPSSDYNNFKETLPSFVNLITDEDIVGKTYNQNWHTQQVVKSQFWKLEISDNYLMIDSDSYFIKPFSLADFMYDEETPYTVLHEQKELFTWSVNKVDMLGFNPKDSFVADRLRIMADIFKRKGRVYDFGPSPCIWSAKVWRDLEELYCKPNNLSFEQLIEYCHSEFTWYGEALLEFKSIPIYPVEPLFKVFHYPQQLNEYYNQKITEEMIAENYMGVVMTSNFGAPVKYSTL